MKTHYHEIPAMVSLTEAAVDLAELANATTQVIESEFNGIKLIIHPGSIAEKIVEAWWHECENRENAYEYNCPEADALEEKAVLLRVEARKAVAKDVIV